MKTIKSETFTTDNGTQIRITVNGEEFSIEGRNPEPSIPQPVDRWTLQHELAGVKLLVVGWGLSIVASTIIAMIITLAVK